MNPDHFRRKHDKTSGKPHCWHIETFHCQQKELEQRYDACYVAAAVGEKACLGLKRRAVKKLSL